MIIACACGGVVEFGVVAALVAGVSWLWRKVRGRWF